MIGMINAARPIPFILLSFLLSHYLVLWDVQACELRWVILRVFVCTTAKDPMTAASSPTGSANSLIIANIIAPMDAGPPTEPPDVQL